MAKEEIINIPAHIDEMRINHLPFLLERSKLPKSKNDISIIDKCKLNSLFTGIPLVKMKRYSASDNRELFDTIENCYETYVASPCPLELTYEGMTYTFRFDFTLHPVDWDDDYKTAQPEFENNPIDIVSFAYIEKGMAYGESDEQQNPKNPRHLRNEVFKKHLPLSTFLDIQGFFLLSYNVLQLYLTTEKIQHLQKKVESLR